MTSIKPFSLLLFFIGLVHFSCAEKRTERPNIIVFLVDDMGWTDTSVPFWKEEVANNRYMQTPNMKKLAAQSLVFTEAYSSSPVCSPTRAAIMTGKNPMRSGITNWIPGESQEENSKYLLPDWNQEGLTPEDVTLPQLLSEAGYSTVHVGKAHFGLEGSLGANPENLGFDKSYAGTHIGSPQAYFPPYDKGQKSWMIPDVSAYAEQGMYLTDAITEVGLKVLDSLSQQQKPFFLNLSHYAVHTPIEAKEEYVEKYRQTGKTETEAKYAAMVQSMDESLGKVLDQLRSLNLDKNTVVIFASDNGGHVIKAAGSPTVNYPASGGKGFWYEGGYRVPFMIRLPEGKAKATAYPTISEDLFPTILAMAKAEVPERWPIDGVDLLQVIQGDNENPTRTEPLIWHYPHYWAGQEIREMEEGIGPFTAIRVGDWKYTYTYDDAKSSLYNLSTDIEEKNNLVEEEKVKAGELVKVLVERMKSVHASRPIDRKTHQPIPYPHL